MKTVKKVIADRHFQELKNDGHTVPRNTKTGETLSFKVGGIYIVFSDSPNEKESITAKCTQNCPCNLKKFN